jgi:hypothetical protein
MYWPLSTKKPKGDGQPVMVFPGFMTSDSATYFLRRFLISHGFEAHPWEQGRNPGLRDEIFQSLLSNIDKHHERYGQKITLIGWSLGGLYARAVAHKRADKVQQVITLGSPFTVETNLSSDEINVSENVIKLYEWLNPDADNDAFLNGEPYWQMPPPVPSTSIYSKSDGVTSWKYCIDDSTGHHTENISIPSSHLGFTHNPMAYHLILDRILTGQKQFKRYKPSIVKRLLFSKGH